MMNRTSKLMVAGLLLLGACATEESAPVDAGTGGGDVAVTDTNGSPDVAAPDASVADVPVTPDAGADTGTPVTTDTAQDTLADTGEPPADVAVIEDGGADVAIVPDAGPVDSGPVDAGGEVTLAGECPLASRVGHFDVGHEDFYSIMAGEVAEGVIPLTVLQLVKEEGSCRLLQKVNPFCEDPCGPGELCNHDGKCIPYPENKSVGTVTIDGLLVPVSMEPDTVNNYADISVPFPMFEPGALVTLEAQGGDLPGFVMHGYGVENLEIPDTVLIMKKGEPLPVAWTPSEGVADIHLSINVDQHGNSPVTLQCDVGDSGEFAVPAPMVTALLESGVSGFASVDIYRRTVDSVQITKGCVELNVFSRLPMKLQVEGHVPCFTTNDCPPGETCQVDINTCVGG